MISVSKAAAAVSFDSVTPGGFMFKKYSVALLVLVLGCQPLVFGVMSPTQPSPLNLVPSGLVSHQNNASGVSTEMGVTLTVEKAPPDDSSYFWAQQFFTSKTVDHGGYFGIQTGGIIDGQRVGKMFIFSIWNADLAEAGGGAFAQTFGGEGVGYSVRLPFQWVEGLPYRFVLKKDGGFWWTLSVTPKNSAMKVIGRIRITQDVPLQSVFVGFTEYFRQLGSCNDLPKVIVGFSDLTYGGQRVSVSSVNPYGSCKNFAKGGLRDPMTVVHEIP
jgi:Domain of unknown function (DUF3472)